MGHFFARRQIVESFETRAEGKLLLGESCAERTLDLLEFFHGEFSGVDAARNLSVKVAANETRESDAEHAPKSHAGDIAELERSVEGDDEGRGRAEDDVKIEPMTRIAQAAEPTPFFAQRIEINEEEKKNTEHAELHADGAARTEDIVLGRERAIGGAERVVVKTIASDNQNDSKGEHPGEEETEFVAAFGIFTN